MRISFLFILAMDFTSCAPDANHSQRRSLPNVSPYSNNNCNNCNNNNNDLVLCASARDRNEMYVTRSIRTIYSCVLNRCSRNTDFDINFRRKPLRILINTWRRKFSTRVISIIIIQRWPLIVIKFVWEYFDHYKRRLEKQIKNIVKNIFFKTFYFCTYQTFIITFIVLHVKIHNIYMRNLKLRFLRKKWCDVCLYFWCRHPTTLCALNVSNTIVAHRQVGYVRSD